MLFFFVRHGHPIYNPDSLTEIGLAQAEALVKRMEVCNPDRIFSSSSVRAVQTAQPTAHKLQKEIELLDWAHEDLACEGFWTTNENGDRCWCFHSPKMRELFVSEEMRQMGKEWYNHPEVLRMGAAKENMLRVQKEADEFFASLGYLHDHERNGYIPVRPNDDRIAMFAHQGFGYEFLSNVLDIPYPELCTRFDFGHSSITVIHFSGKEFVIPKVLQLSNDSHLFASGMETLYHQRILF